MPRAKGLGYPYKKKASPKRNDNTAAVAKKRGGVKILSTEGAKAVGRPGFGGFVPGPSDSKASVRRLMVRDPAKGITQPGADVITDTKVDLVGPVNPKIVSDSATLNPTSPNTGKKVIRPPRQSAPVRTNKPGKVTRPGR